MILTTNNHNSGIVTTTPSVFNDTTLLNNNKEFAKVDTRKGDVFVFAQRPLDPILGVQVPVYTTNYLDKNNLETTHEHGFFEDGTGDSIDMFSSSFRIFHKT